MAGRDNSEASEGREPAIGEAHPGANPALPGAGQTVAILCVQGAFAEHRHMLESLGARCIELRQASDLEKPFDKLVLPGGESTVQGKLLRELGMFDDLRKRIADGMPVLATCAGLILLAEWIDGGEAPHLATLPCTVRRNAYGRQLGSFFTTAAFWPDGMPRDGGAGGEIGPSGAGDAGGPSGAIRIPMTFIRAPYVSEVRDGTQVLAEVDGRIVAVRNGNQLGCAFHPELGGETLVHRMFLEMGGE